MEKVQLHDRGYGDIIARVSPITINGEFTVTITYDGKPFDTNIRRMDFNTLRDVLNKCSYFGGFNVVKQRNPNRVWLQTHNNLTEDQVKAINESGLTDILGRLA